MNLPIDLIKKIHETNYKIYCSFAGGGYTFISDYLSVPGASKNFVYGEIPYSKEGFESLTGRTDKFVTQEAALELAKTSYRKCVELTKDKVHAIGVGVTCCLATENEREGREHKIFVSTYSHKRSNSTFLILKQGRTREAEENLASSFILDELLAEIKITAPNFYDVNFTEEEYGGHESFLHATD